MLNLLRIPSSRPIWNLCTIRCWNRICAASSSLTPAFRYKFKLIKYKFKVNIFNLKKRFRTLPEWLPCQWIKLRRNCLKWFWIGNCPAFWTKVTACSSSSSRPRRTPPTRPLWIPSKVWAKWWTLFTRRLKSWRNFAALCVILKEIKRIRPVYYIIIKMSTFNWVFIGVIKT